MPYTVLGWVTVFCGQAVLGTCEPKTAMLLGQNTRHPVSRATSSTFNSPCILRSHACWGCCSPLAERYAAKWYIVFASVLATSERNACRSITSSKRKLTSVALGCRISVATTCSLPYRARSAEVSSVPSWPVAPVITICCFCMLNLFIKHGG